MALRLGTSIRNAALTTAAAIALLAGTFSYATAVEKKLSNEVQGSGGAWPATVDNHRAEATLKPTDAMQRIDGREIKAQALDGYSTNGIAASSITLVCGAITVRTSHAEIAVTEDSNTHMGYFGYTPFTLNLADVAAIAPPITTNPVWCHLKLPQSGGSTWTFTNALRLDEQLPDVTTPTNLTTGPIIPIEGGKAYWSWSYNDPFTPPDPDGDVNTCGSDACNKTDSRYQFQFYSKNKLAADYGLPPIGSSGPAGTYADLPEVFATSTDNFMVTSDDRQYCLSLRMQDTAGNFSPKASGADVKCFVPDAKAPQFQRVGFFLDSAFTKEFPKDNMGNYTVTSNPCHFFPGTCDRDAGHPRYIYLRLAFSEPLFDGQFWGGVPHRPNDGLDNDSDGSIEDETGGYDGVDNDGDGFIDEDVSMTACVPTASVAGDGIDNDCDGYVDEEPNGSNGRDDDGDGRTDEDTTITFCAAKQLYNRARGTCVPSPRLTILGPDNEGIVPGPIGTNNSNDLLTWRCTSYPGNADPLCAGLPTGTTIYSYRWEVSGINITPIGLIEGPYEIKMVQGIDASGNAFTTLTPEFGGNVNMDNSAPDAQIQYFKNNTYTTGIPAFDHDGSDEPVHPCGIGSADTVKMSALKEGPAYFQITMTENAGATPSVAMYTPAAAAPTYCGIPMTANIVPVTVYTTCSQPPSCDPCTGNNCIAYSPDTAPCAIFRGCAQIASTTYNDGYVSMGVHSQDRLSNTKWDPTDASAAASQQDTDGLSDDTNGDGYPTYIPGTLEADSTLTLGQNFAIDTRPPDPPALSLPITPCNGTVARTGPTCSMSSQTTRSPTLTWTRLSNNLDDDGDSNTDEETYDYVDNDGDGTIDEDVTAPATGTMAWEIKSWHLQVSTAPDFASGTLVKDDLLVEQANTIVSNLAERTLTSPYYWRVSAYDHAGNEGAFSPPGGYYTFGIDITPPQISGKYFSDSARANELVKNDENIAVTGDTASQGKRIYMTLVTDTPVSATPTFKLRQGGQILISNTTARNPANPDYEFFADFEVDAIGSGQVFSDGLVDLLVTTSDLYGNAITDTAPATGAQFFVDTQAPYISPGDITVSHNPASMDNDGDGMPGEITEDAVTIRVQASEYLRYPFKIRVKQYGFPEAPSLNDAIDNDCDGKIDEEIQDGIDNDSDGKIDEDTGTHGALPGSGCLITMEREGTTPGAYTGKYNVFPGYDGKAQILIGYADPASPYWAGDYAGNSVTATAEFTIDTIPPDPPSLVIPLHDQHLQSNTPTLGWQVPIPRPSGLSKYRVQLADNQGFSPTIADVYQNDDGVSTTFYYTVPSDLSLTDGKYYWRTYAIDTAQNRSVPSVASTFHVDTQPPAPPKFNAVQTPTVERSSPLSGTAEVNSVVEIYVNGILIGEVNSSAAGVFTVGIDDDLDGQIDEDIIDGADNDLDGKVDEDPIGIFLAEGDNIVEGRLIDSAGNVGSRGCDPTTPFYNNELQQCIITLDSGAPTFKVLYFSDSALTTPLPFNTSTNRFQAKPGAVYLKIIASEDLPSPPTYSVDQQGTTDISNAPTTSIDGSPRNFKGSYTVNTHNGATYIDGDARVTAKGTDSQGNTTPNGVLPSVGAYFNIDTRPSTYKVDYFRDEDLTQRLYLDEHLLPNAKAGGIYLRIEASEQQSSAPKVSIDQPGTADIVDAVSTGVKTAYGTSTVLFKYKYTAQTADGSSYVDGNTSVVFSGTDLAGNQALVAEPTTNGIFVIDTTAPAAPVIILEATTTLFTQMDITGTSEPLTTVQVYVRADRNMTVDDGIDNDGDGNIDEEPADGIDNDNDLFIDEDTTANTCPAGKYWSFLSNTCATALPSPRQPNGTTTASINGGEFTATVTGIYMGRNLVTARAIDFAGNISEFATPQSLYNNSPENVNLTHEFSEGWNLAGIPMQPSMTNPNSALGGTGGIFRLQGGIYKTDLELQPLEPGACYWVNYTSATEVTLWGITSTTRSVRLTRGWNMVGIPYNKAVNWDANIIVKKDNQEFALGTPEANNILEPYVYFFDSPSSDFQTRKGIPDNIQLQPWQGFLLKANEDCYIQFPIP